MESKWNLLKLIALAGIVFAAFNFAATKRFAADLVSRVWTTESPAPAPSPSPTPSPEAIQAQSLVKSYMLKNAVPGSTLSFLDWSDFSGSAQTSAITLHYRVQQPAHPDILASVRFTLQAGNVVKVDLVQPATQPAAQSAAQPVAASTAEPSQTPPPVVTDRFSAPIAAATHGSPMTLELSNAYSLAQLEAAKARAQSERKPIGFLMVWGQFFDHPAEPRSDSSDSALVHFYEVFNDQLVLVFVRHETELGLVPRAVMRGFNGPNEGGYAPNMAVTDASATEFIVEIPYRNRDGPGRDQLFAEGGSVIDQWLATHPDAMATPAPSPAGNP